jgi:hypothetical protein
VEQTWNVLDGGGLMVATGNGDDQRMVLEAAVRLGLNIDRIYVIGDSLETAKAVVLVKATSEPTPTATVDFDTAMQRISDMRDEYEPKKIKFQEAAAQEGREIIIPEELILPEHLERLTAEIAAGTLTIADDIRIVSREEARRTARNRTTGGKRIILLTPEMEREWGLTGPDCYARKIILSDDEQRNAIFLGGSIALARAINAEDGESAALFYNRLTGEEADVEAVLTERRLELRLPAIEVRSADEFDRLKEEAYKFLRAA